MVVNLFIHDRDDHRDPMNNSFTFIFDEFINKNLCILVYIINFGKLDSIYKLFY